MGGGKGGKGGTGDKEERQDVASKERRYRWGQGEVHVGGVETDEDRKAGRKSNREGEKMEGIKGKGEGCGEG